MLVTYKGDSTALTLNVQGKAYRLVPSQPAVIDDKQVGELIKQPFIKVLIIADLLEISEDADAKAEAKAKASAEAQKAEEAKVEAEAEAAKVKAQSEADAKALAEAEAKAEVEAKVKADEKPADDKPVATKKK